MAELLVGPQCVRDALASRAGWGGFHLSDKVLIVLLTTSIANFLALLTIIARFLFHGERDRSAI